MDMNIEAPEQKETVPCGIQDVTVPPTATELTAKEGSPQERVISGILESFIDRTFSKDHKDKYPIDSLVEKTKMITEMIGATDLVSNMLAIQIVAVHDLQTAIIARAFKNPDNQQAVSMAAKLSNTFIQQIGMMEKLRGHGQQKVVVEHVHVHKGGQAIVGNVTGG